MRTWMQIAAISSAAENVRAGIEKLAEGVWDNVLLEGYDHTLTDVEHSAEPSADTLPGMLLLRYGDPLWVERTLQSCHTIKTHFMGIDDEGYPRFKSSSFGNLQVGDPLFAGGDTGYCARAMKHYLWAAWQGNAEARDWLVGWADGWRVPSLKEIDGKIAGFVPLTLWYPAGNITPPVEGKKWHDERMNYWSRPDMVHDTFLAAYWLTGDTNFLVPFQMATQLASQGPLPGGDLERGSREWQLARLAHLPHNMPAEQHKVGLYRWLTGDKAYDEYAWRTADATLKYRLNGDLESYRKRFEAAARSGRHNLEVQTSEVMATDRAGVPAALAADPAAHPAPTSVPTRLWVVEIGIPTLVAKRTVRPAPRATAWTYCELVTRLPSTSPRPLKFFNNCPARKTAVSEPRKVVTVAQSSAPR